MDKSLKSWLKNFKLNESAISTLLGALVVIVIGVLIFNYFNRGQESLTPEELSQGITVSEEADEIASKSLPAKHTVQANESLWKLAVAYYQDGYQWSKIAEANNLTNPDLLFVDQELTIPQIEVSQKDSQIGESISGEKYTVKTGDCLWTIALRAYGDAYKWTEIAEANNLVNPDLIHAGNEFVLPRGK